MRKAEARHSGARGNFITLIRKLSRPMKPRLLRPPSELHSRALLDAPLRRIARRDPINLDENLVRDRAYSLWLEDGGVIGRADHYWFKAERELLATLVTSSLQAVAGSAKQTARKPATPRKRASVRGITASPIN